MAALSTQQLIQFCYRVGTSLKSGVGVVRLWETEAKRASSSHQPAFQKVLEQISAGVSLADAMRGCDKFFPPLVCDMVEVGEKTGHLDEVFLRLSEHYKQQSNLQWTFLRGIAWPALELAFAIVLIGAMIGILGAIGGTGLDGKPTDVLGIGLIGIRGMFIFWLICGAILAWLALMVYSVLRGWWGPGPILIAMRVPVLGRALESMSLARLTWSLSMALNSGMDALRSVELSIRTTLNLYYTSHIPAVLGALRQGNQFFEAFATPKAFPQDFIDSLEVAEISGTTSESLERLAQEYEAKAKTSLMILTGICTTLVMLGVMGLMVFLIFRLFWVLYAGPMYELLDDINKT